MFNRGFQWRRDSARALKSAMVGFLLSLTAGTVQAQSGPFLGRLADNPFAFTLSDDLFPVTVESRADKAARVFSDNFTTFDEDLYDFISFPVRKPLTFGAYAAGIGALTLVDRQTTMAYQEAVVPLGRKINLPNLDFVPFVSSDGEYILGVIGATYAYGLLANDEKSQAAALMATKAVAYSYLVSHVILKTGFGRSRPVPSLRTQSSFGPWTTNPYKFFGATDVHFPSRAAATAMPSFHFTLYYSTARVYAGVYDNYLIPYTAATLLALSSAEGHNHWVSDMVAGALIGTAIGNVILTNYDDQKRNQFSSVVPYVTRDGAGVSFQMRF